MALEKGCRVLYVLFVFLSPEFGPIKFGIRKKEHASSPKPKKTLWRREQKRARESESAHIKNINKPFSLVCVCAEREESEKQLLKKDALRCDFFQSVFRRSWTRTVILAPPVLLLLLVFFCVCRDVNNRRAELTPQLLHLHAPSQRVRCKCN